jgi:hypothetical protein
MVTEKDTVQSIPGSLLYRPALHYKLLSFGDIYTRRTFTSDAYDASNNTITSHHPYPSRLYETSS